MILKYKFLFEYISLMTDRLYVRRYNCAYSIHNSRCSCTLALVPGTLTRAVSIMRLEKLEWQSGMAINYCEFSLINCTPRRAIACSQGTAINTGRSAKGHSRFVTVVYSRITQAVLRSIV